MKTVPLSLHEHSICLCLGCLPIAAGVLFKLFVPTKLFEAFVSKNEA